jgi:hypothetical protein
LDDFRRRGPLGGTAPDCLIQFSMALGKFLKKYVTVNKIYIIQIGVAKIEACAILLYCAVKPFFSKGFYTFIETREGSLRRPVFVIFLYLTLHEMGSMKINLSFSPFFAIL